MNGQPDPDYPARCQAASHSCAGWRGLSGPICLHGRLVSLQGERGRIQDLSGAADFHLNQPGVGQVGDIVELRGQAGNQIVEQGQLSRLVPARHDPFAGGDWPRFQANGGLLHKRLALRSAILQAIRQFFLQRDFIEVETPALVEAPGQEAHLQHFQTRYRGGAGRPLYLITSPEHHMKRMLAAGCERIFQMGRCFRNGERSPLHNPEFTMVEWYRAYASYREICADTQDLCAFVARQVLGRTTVEYGGRSVDLAQPWKRIGVHEALAQYAGVDLRRCRSAQQLRQAALQAGHASMGPEDSWDDMFFKLLIERVEPALAQEGAVFLQDYPARQGALAKRKADWADVAERVEGFLAGLELANGFTELNDPAEQRQRFTAEARVRLAAGHGTIPLDEDFLDALQRGMPPAGGMALGVDRLIMVLTGAEHIDEVLAFPLRVEEGLS